MLKIEGFSNKCARPLRQFSTLRLSRGCSKGLPCAWLPKLKQRLVPSTLNGMKMENSLQIKLQGYNPLCSKEMTLSLTKLHSF